MKKTLLAVFILLAVLLSTNCFALDVLVNQVGFERYSPKVFKVQRTSDYGGNGAFSVRKVSDNSQVCTGTLVRKGGLWDKWIWEGDFTPLTVSGDYYISATVDAETNNSYNFTVGSNTLLNQTGVLTYQYFWTQRCGVAVPGWHAACHLDDGIRSDNSQHWDAVGGWHDAGDYNKFPHGFAGNGVLDLLWLYDSNRSYFDGIDVINSVGGNGSNGIPDILDEALWQARWLAKMVDTNGHCLQQTRIRRTGATWVKPESDTNNIIGSSDDRWIDPGTEVTPQETVVCASLARMHVVLASKGMPTENFASKALAIWDHRVQLAIQEGGHNNLGSGAHQVFAGFDLYAIYGQQNCWDRAYQRIDELVYVVTNNPNVFDNALYCESPGYELAALAWYARTYPTQPNVNAARSAVQSLMSRFKYLADDPIGLMRRDYDGTLDYFQTNTDWNGYFIGINRLYLLAAWAAIESYKLIGDASYLRFAMDQYNWVMGANYNRVCMMEGIGDYNLPRYHTRYDTISGHSSGKQPGCVPNGYVRVYSSGLPNVDLSSNRWQSNEGWLINNAAYAAALAAMPVFQTSNQTPYGGVTSLPGTIQAENYDNGGESLSCHDYDSANNGAIYRTDSVDIETTSDTGGGYNVGWVEPGEWLEYTVNVATTNTYTISVRAATLNNGCSFHIEMDGVNVTGAQAVPNTGGWQAWTTVNIPNVALNAGQQVLSIHMDSGAWNFNHIQVAVTANVNNAQVMSDTIPTTMTAGQQYNVSVTMKNIGTTTWTASGTNAYKLGGVGDSDPFYNPPTNPPYRVLLNAGETVAPNAQRTFTFTMTAPATPGQYTTDWRMVQEWIEWFGGTLTKQVTVNPAGPVTFSTSSFDADANGWAISLWHSGQYTDGTMAWNSGAGRTGGGIRTIGSGSSDNTDRCTREGGEIQKTISTVGYNSISVSYDLRVNTLGGNYTGVGAGTCGVDHNLIDEQLTVYYSTNGGTNWTEAEYITRSSLLGYTSYGTRTINLAGVSACNNNANFKLRFRWQVNGTSDTVDLDNIKVTGTP